MLKSLRNALVIAAAMSGISYSGIVESRGALKTSGNKIVDASNKPIQLAGMSLYHSGWSSRFWNAGVVGTLANDWKSTVVRAAMGIEGAGQYLEDPAGNKARVKTVVDAAIAQGIYVIIAWEENNATIHTSQAKAFFQEMAQLYADKPNVIFEIYSEPDNESWAQIKTYAQTIIPAIRVYSRNLVIVGTPNWSQQPDVAAASPLSYENVAYSLQFWAGSHIDRTRANNALAGGIPLFLSKWGTSDASEQGAINVASSDAWLAWAKTNSLSWCNWSISEVSSTSSALKSGASGSGAWSDANLTASGLYAKSAIKAITSSTYALSLAIDANGTISANPSQPAGGYPVGTIVNLTATPRAGYQFLGWSGACYGTGNCSVTMNSNLAVGAGFLPIPAFDFAKFRGALKTRGNKILDASDKPIQLAGMSLYHSGWGSRFWNASVVGTLANDWKSTVVRAAMGIEGAGQYLEDPAGNKARVKTVVDAAIAQGIYVIIAWEENNATIHTSQAKAFFQEMAQLYADKPNVIFEIYSEPDNESWAQIKTYAQTIIPAIRAYSKNLVIVGTPSWSQQPDVAADNPLSYENVAYSLQFWAGSQTDRTRANNALARGIPLFLSKWGTTDAFEQGAINPASSDAWLAWAKTNSLSWCNWSISDRSTTSSALKSGASGSGGWSDANLTASGLYAKSAIKAVTSSTTRYSLTLSGTTNGILSANPTQPTGGYVSGTVVTIVATPNSGYQLSGWSGACSGTGSCSVTMDANKNVGAAFAPPPTANKLVNGDFANGANSWNLSVYGGSASGSVTGGEYVTTISTAGTQAWHVQFTQGGVKLEQGKTYTLSFKARAAANRTVEANVGMSASPYTSYIGAFNATLTTTSQRFSKTFVVTQATTTTARVEFNSGLSNVRWYLDDVTLIEGTSVNPAAPPGTFAPRSMDHGAPGSRLAVSGREITFDASGMGMTTLELRTIDGAKSLDLWTGFADGPIAIATDRIPRGIWIATLKGQTASKGQLVNLVR